jgi:hypothetical protein
MIVLGRDVKEGQPYDVARSSYLGEYGLALFTVIAVTILQRGGIHIPPWLGWMENYTIQVWMMCIISVLCDIVCVFTIGSRSGHLMDVYHDVVVCPILLYLSITLVPIVWCNGTTVEKVTVSSLFLLWIVSVIFDHVHDRINQRRWLQKKFGVIFPARRFS